MQMMRPIEEIAAESAEAHGVCLIALRGRRQTKKLRAARREALQKIWAERPDLSSGQVALYFNRDGSAVRHLLRSMGAME